MKTCSARAFLLSFLVVESVHATAWAQSKVSCVGDSITAGDSSAPSYPARLQGLFGSTAIVQNAGSIGATMLNSGELPYVSTSSYGASSEFVAQGGDVVIQLGTNDSTSKNWTSSAAFTQDCEDLVRHYQSTSPATRVWLSLVPPAFDGACCKIDGTVIQNEIIPALRTCAKETGAASIDVFGALDGHPEYFADGVHPNEQGAAAIAQTVYSKLSRQPEVSLISSGPSAAEGGALALTAGPSAAYGEVEKVRFYEGSTLLAEIESGPWTLLLNGLTRGTHVYHAEALETGGRVAESRPIAIKVTETAPLSTDRPSDAPTDEDDGAVSSTASSSPDATSPSSNSSTRTTTLDSEVERPERGNSASGCSVAAAIPQGGRSSWAHLLAVSSLVTVLNRRRRRRAGP